MPLVHAYNQTVADGTATSVVRPSDWNSAHNQIMSFGGNTSGASSISGTNIVFQGGNNVTISGAQGAGAATIIFSGANTTPQPVAFSASGGSSLFSTLGFSNQGNDVTFSNSGGSVAIIHGLQATSATSNITSNAFPSANTTKFAGTGTTFAGTNVTATVGLNSNGLALSLSGPATTAFLTTARASNDAIGLNSALTANGLSVTANSSGLSINVPAWLTTAANSSHSHNFATTTTAGSNIVVGTNNSIGATIGVPAFITTFAAQTNQTAASGNIAGVGTTFAGTNVSATLGLNSNGLALSLSGPAAGGGGAGNIVQIGTTGTTGTAFSSASGTIQINGSNNITVSQNNSNQIIISGPSLTQYLTTARGSTDAIGLNSALTANGLSVTANSSGLSINVPAWLTTAANSSHSHNFATTTTAGSNIVVGTANSLGATIGVPAFITTFAAQTNQTAASGNIAGVGTTFAGTNITATLGLNSAGLALSLSGPATTQFLTTAAQSNISHVFATTSTVGSQIVVGTNNSVGATIGVPGFITTYVAQTTQTQPAGIIAGVGTTFGGTNISATMGFNSNGLALSLSGPAAGGGAGDGVNIIQLGTTGTTGTSFSASTGTVFLNGGNNITVSQNGSNQLVISGPNLTQYLTTARLSNDAIGLNTAVTNATVTINSSGFSFNGAGYAGTGTTFNGTNISATVAHDSNGLNLSLSGPAAGGGAALTIADLEPVPFGGNSSYSSYGQNTLYFQNITLPNYLSITAIEMMATVSSATSSVSHSVGQTISYGFFSKGTGASTSAYYPATTNSMYIGISYSSNLSGGMTVANGVSSYTVTSNGTVFGSNISGAKLMSLPIVALLNPNNDYIFGIANSTASVGNTGAFRMSFLVMTVNTNASMGVIATNTVAATNLTVTNEPTMKQYSVTSNAWPATVIKSNMNVFVSAPRAYMYLEG